MYKNIISILFNFEVSTNVSFNPCLVTHIGYSVKELLVEALLRFDVH